MVTAREPEPEPEPACTTKIGRVFGVSLSQCEEVNPRLVSCHNDRQSVWLARGQII
ncbi:hypothetical protein K0M31_003081 [Melipona bicolor]|uniref:Uncharacterized protein n=1 Tax=Melipona bicolor TaxID=60889 RepID=A0AA40KQ40_9HYME|nr:hypothetical protein K0M31_003081 [Melipona bicolor]